MSNLNRRQFVAGSAAVAAAAALAGTAAPAVAEQNGTPGAATVPGLKGDVTVSLSLDEETGKVCDVVVEGPYETPGRGSVAIQKMQDAMNETGSIDVDLVSSATVTSTAVLDAAAIALAVAQGDLPDAPAPAPADGTYEASSYGFYPGLPVTVQVQIAGGAIQEISIVGENLETAPMLRAAFELWIPRAINAQSVSVDTICGATMTTAAVRLAVEDCVKQALAAADAPERAIANWLVPVTPVAGAPIEIQKDVVVVGLGGAGMMSALSAAENGLSVIAIDKAGKYGGTTCVTSESFAVNAPKLQAELNGGADWVPAAELEEDWWGRTHGEAKRNMLDLFFAESGNTIDWLNYEHRWPFNAPNPGHADYATYDCCYTYAPYTLSGRKIELSSYIDGIMDQFCEMGGEYLLEVEATGLLTDDSGRVVGVRAVGLGGQEYIIRAKATVIGTGGFGENIRLMNQFMIDDYYPLSGTWHLYGMATNDGKMVEAALDLGAATCNPSVPPLSHLAGFPVNLFGFGTHMKDEPSFFTGYTAIWSEGDIPQSLCVAGDSLAVTRKGERFINEMMFANHGAIKAGPEYYTIWSQGQLDTFAKQGLSYADPGPSMGYCGCQSTIPLGEPLPQMDAVMEAGIATGYIAKADTLTELAEKVGIDAAVLEATVARYNELCEAGVDEDFGKDPALMVPVAEGPFYAVLGVAFYYTTGGALDIDETMQVLREDGTPIEGLYAVGTDSMGVLMTNQEQYLDYGGAASGWAFTSGRLVGKALAAKLA